MMKGVISREYRGCRAPWWGSIVGGIHRASPIGCRDVADSNEISGRLDQTLVRPGAGRVVLGFRLVRLGSLHSTPGYQIPLLRSYHNRLPGIQCYRCNRLRGIQSYRCNRLPGIQSYRCKRLPGI